jgi:mannose-6-phosphate isomerase-like protein (cupin superfamily)
MKSGQLRGGRRKGRFLWTCEPVEAPTALQSGCLFISMMLSAGLLCAKLVQKSNRRRVMAKSERGAVVICQPDEGESFWQPMPANGYAEVRVSGRNSRKIAGFSSSMQTVAPGCYLSGHKHDANEGLLFFYEGTGRAVINGKVHPIRPGTTVYVGPRNRHSIISDGETELKLMWVLLPGGLEDFFEAVGRPRRPGDPAPFSFPRPENADETERQTVFAGLDAASVCEAANLLPNRCADAHPPPIISDNAS